VYLQDGAVKRSDLLIIEVKVKAGAVLLFVGVGNVAVILVE